MSGTRQRRFYGWWIVLTCALGLLLGPIPIMVFSFGVFLKPFVREFHAGRGAISLALMISTVAVGIGSPFAGRLIDRLGARRVILPAHVLAGLILLAVYFCSGNIWQLYLFYLSLGLISSGLAPVSYSHVVTHWFDRRRGLALGLMMLGLGTGALVMPSIAQALISKIGWRLTFATIGAVILVVTVPTLARFLVEKPESMGLLADGMPQAVIFGEKIAPGVSWGEAWRTQEFWLSVRRRCSGLCERAGVLRAYCLDPCGSGRAGRDGSGHVARRSRPAGRQERIGLSTGPLLCAAGLGTDLLLYWRGHRSASDGGDASAGIRGSVSYWDRAGRGGRHHGLPDQPVLRAALVRSDLRTCFRRLRDRRRTGRISDGRVVRCDRLVPADAGRLLPGGVGRRCSDAAAGTISLPGRAAKGKRHGTGCASGRSR